MGFSHQQQERRRSFQSKWSLLNRKEFLSRAIKSDFRLSLPVICFWELLYFWISYLIFIFSSPDNPSIFFLAFHFFFWLSFFPSIHLFFSCLVFLHFFFLFIFSTLLWFLCFFFLSIYPSFFPSLFFLSSFLSFLHKSIFSFLVFLLSFWSSIYSFYTFLFFFFFSFLLSIYPSSVPDLISFLLSSFLLMSAFQLISCFPSFLLALLPSIRSFFLFNFLPSFFPVLFFFRLPHQSSSYIINFKTPNDFFLEEIQKKTLNNIRCNNHSKVGEYALDIYFLIFIAGKSTWHYNWSAEVWPQSEWVRTPLILSCSFSDKYHKERVELPYPSLDMG